MQHSRGRRRGSCFTVRISDDERRALEATQVLTGGPSGLGPWLVWRALAGASPSEALPARGAPATQIGLFSHEAVPELAAPPIEKRIVLDLCGGSGSWSEPYRAAGYDVRIIDPRVLGDVEGDVRTYVPPPRVWGVLAAPPCTEFSIARNGCPDKPRDFPGAMSIVSSCLRIVLQTRPQWWALENPAGGHLAKWLGAPRDTWEPYEFGDAWTKRTALWGDFAIPRRGPFAHPEGSACDRSTPEARAITPPGFARAFFDVNA